MAAKKEFDSDMIVLFEDQQRINLIARKNVLRQDLKQDISAREKQIQNAEDAADELELMDEEDLVPYEVGEVFVKVTIPDALKKLEERKQRNKEELSALRDSMAEVDKQMKTTKSQLYAKFGDSINLEQPDTATE